MATEATAAERARDRCVAEGRPDQFMAYYGEALRETAEGEGEPR